jgi:hypothetical protein
VPQWPTSSWREAQRRRMLTAIEAAISTIELIRTISGRIFTPWVDSLKKVRRPALDAGIGALFFLLLIEACARFFILKRNGWAARQRRLTVRGPGVAA